MRVDQYLANFDWPATSHIDFPQLEPNDCLLLCAGFEDRSIETLLRISSSDVSNLSVIVVEYQPNYPQNKLAQILDLCERTHISLHRCVYDRERPEGIGTQLVALTRNFERVFLDISGMSRLLIVQALVALLRHGGVRVSILYAEAMTYPPSEQDFRIRESGRGAGNPSSYLSSGIFEVASTPELGSVAMLGESIRLIAFPSFDPSQLSNLVSELQPTYANLIHGLPPLSKDRWRRVAIADLNQHAIRSLQSREEAEASTLDYRETMHLLLEIYSNRSMFDRIVVAPTGSKMQAVAVGLFRAALRDIQIVYPTPRVFNAPEEHTLGCRQLYVLDCPAECFSSSITSI